MSRRKRESKLKLLLAAYPPYRIPHPGAGCSLSIAQAEANLAFLLANKTERLNTARTLLRQFSLDLDAGLAASDPKPFLDAVWRWSIEEWPAVFDPDLVSSIERWLESTRDGPDIVFSMLMDVGIVLTEMVLVRRGDYAWRLDLDPENFDMTTFRRPVVSRLADAVVPIIQFDFEGTARSCYAQCTDPSYGVLNDLGRGVLNALSGAHERAWREDADRAAPPGKNT